MALLAAFVPLTPAAAADWKLRDPARSRDFHRSEQLRGYLTSHMAEAQPVDWRFEPAATGDAPTPDRVKWHFKLDPYEVRTVVPPYTDEETFAVHRPITIEAPLSEWEISDTG